VSLIVRVAIETGASFGTRIVYDVRAPVAMEI
jgi:hypothetical protein